jgi:DnaK suppressor protein
MPNKPKKPVTPAKPAKPAPAAKPVPKASSAKKPAKHSEPARTAAPAKKLLAVKTESPEDRKERLRKVLIQRREDIVKESKTEIKKYVSGEKRQLVETVLDDGDLSVVDLSEDISLKQLSTHRETLLKIDIALRKLQDDTYGLCEECGDDISEERLKILPFAICCRDCQEEREIREKLEREDGTL